MKIYLAGPLFTAGEKEFNKQLAVLLRAAGHDVWMPQEECANLVASQDIFESCIDGIEWCEVILGNMDQPDPDSGTSWEVGYGYALHKKVILFRTDFRKNSDHISTAYNIMLYHSAAENLNCSFYTVEEVVLVVLKTLEKYNNNVQCRRLN